MTAPDTAQAVIVASELAAPQLRHAELARLTTELIEAMRAPDTMRAARLATKIERIIKRDIR